MGLWPAGKFLESDTGAEPSLWSCCLPALPGEGVTGCLILPQAPSASGSPRLTPAWPRSFLSPPAGSAPAASDEPPRPHALRAPGPCPCRFLGENPLCLPIRWRVVVTILRPARPLRAVSLTPRSTRLVGHHLYACFSFKFGSFPRGRTLSQTCYIPGTEHRTRHGVRTPYAADLKQRHLDP